MPLPEGKSPLHSGPSRPSNRPSLASPPPPLVQADLTGTHLHAETAAVALALVPSIPPVQMIDLVTRRETTPSALHLPLALEASRFLPLPHLSPLYFSAGVSLYSLLHLFGNPCRELRRGPCQRPAPRGPKGSPDLRPPACVQSFPETLLTRLSTSSLVPQKVRAATVDAFSAAFGFDEVLGAICVSPGAAPAPSP